MSGRREGEARPAVESAKAMPPDVRDPAEDPVLNAWSVQVWARHLREQAEKRRNGEAA